MTKSIRKVESKPELEVVNTNIKMNNQKDKDESPKNN